MNTYKTTLYPNSENHIQVSVQFDMSQFRISFSGDYTTLASELHSCSNQRHWLCWSVAVAVREDRCQSVGSMPVTFCTPLHVNASSLHQNKEIRDKPCYNICGNCQKYMRCKLANPLTKCILLVIGQIQDEFSTSRNKCSSLILKPCKSDQETSEEVLFIKARQMSRQNHTYRGLMLNLDKSCICRELRNQNFQI